MRYTVELNIHFYALEAFNPEMDRRFPVLPRAYLFDHVIAVGMKGKTPGELWYPTGIAIDGSTNEIYITEGYYKTSRVSVYSVSGDYLNHFKCDDMSRPFDLEIYENNLYITDAEKHSVLRFKLADDNHDVRLIKKIGGIGSDVAEFRDPRQLAVSVIGDVFISDRSNHRIQIFDRSLKHQRQISHKSMKYPRSVKLTPDQVYVLSETDSPCVHTFSYSGDKIRSIIPCGPGKAVTQPYFLFIDPNNRLFISDWNNHEVKIFSKKGKLLRSLGERGDDAGMFNYPSGIALTNNLKLIVVSLNKNFGLQIFSIQ